MNITNTLIISQRGWGYERQDILARQTGQGSMVGAPAEVLPNKGGKPLPAQAYRPFIQKRQGDKVDQRNITYKRGDDK